LPESEISREIQNSHDVISVQEQLDDDHQTYSGDGANRTCNQIRPFQSIIWPYPTRVFDAMSKPSDRLEG
jgi:hypothetical protein